MIVIAIAVANAATIANAQKKITAVATAGKNNFLGLKRSGVVWFVG